MSVLLFMTDSRLFMTDSRLLVTCSAKNVIEQPLPSHSEPLISKPTHLNHSEPLVAGGDGADGQDFVC